MTPSGEPPIDLEIRLLGPLEVWRGGARLSLPRSKKTRALLSYLAATGREHTRTHLCSLLWDTTDDPRGALRWSLSKLRPLVDGRIQRLDADRERVRLVARAARIDFQELAAAGAGDVATAPTARLEGLEGLLGGEFLEGLELADLFEFQAWCIARREQARELRCRLLGELVRRLSETPSRALPYARNLVQADSFGVPARRVLLDLLLRAGKLDEARQQFEMARRLFEELEAPGLSDLLSAWSALSATSSRDVATPRLELPDAAQGGPPDPEETARLAPGPDASTIVGRHDSLQRLRGLLELSRSTGRQTIALVSGEPGVGKSRLAAALVAEARQAGAAVLEGRAYEAESTRPFGPWADALGADVSEWRPKVGDGGTPATREVLFQTVADAMTAHAAAAGGALLVLDDLQWLDRDSAELLHFVARAARERPLAIVLLARSGELDDNEPVLRLLRGLRRESRLDRLDLQPLSRQEIGELVAAYPCADSDEIYSASAGNPLYALELARAAVDGTEGPSTLALLVRERVARLPPAAADVLRWGAVLGHSIDVARLESLSSLEPEELVRALERLEHHTLLHSEESGAGARYVFAHDLVREVIYGELSHPRRRLMHRQVARLLAPGLADPAIATEVARHASLAGDALLGVRACIDAGLAALRVFANADAEALARRGLDLVDRLEETDRIAHSLDLLHVQYSAHAPDREQAAVRVAALAEQALDLGLTRPARLGFQMLSFLRWESSSMAAAHANILQAERVSRLAEPEERADALAHAARCFVLLERNLEQAEAFLLEAELLASRGGKGSSAVPFATAMLHVHRGELDEAARAFREARWLGREAGDRLAEFAAVEHWTMLEIDRGDRAAAQTLATQAAVLGERVRPGAEGPSGRALLALVRRLREAGGSRPTGTAGPEAAAEPQESSDTTAASLPPGLPLAQAIEELRLTDAKYELAFVLTRLARHELALGDLLSARSHAAAGLDCAVAIGRASEIALSHALLARCAQAAGNSATASEHLAALCDLRGEALAAGVRSELEALMGNGGGSTE